jgi:hypothetical protein
MTYKTNPAGGRGGESTWEGADRCNDGTTRNHKLHQVAAGVHSDDAVVFNEALGVTIVRLPALVCDDDKPPFTVEPMAVIEPWVSSTGAARIVLFAGWTSSIPIAIEAPMTWLTSRRALVNGLREAGVFLPPCTGIYNVILDSLPRLRRLRTSDQAAAFWQQLESGAVEGSE